MLRSLNREGEGGGRERERNYTEILVSEIDEQYSFKSSASKPLSIISII